MKPLPSTAGSEEQRRRVGNSRHHGDAINDNKSPPEEAAVAQLVGGGFLLPKASPSSMAILLQNCDLPTPQKLFGPDYLFTSLAPASKAAFFSPSPIKPTPCMGDDNDLSRLIRDAALMEGENKDKHKDSHDWVVEPQLTPAPADGRDEKGTGGLLKAMRLSQTRAREAEAKATQLGKTTDRMAVLLLDESMRLHAYRQWVKLLQAEIATLQKRRSATREGPTTTAAAPAASGDDGVDIHCDGGSGGAGTNSTATWMAWAVVLAVAGVGLAVGCKYFL